MTTERLADTYVPEIVPDEDLEYYEKGDYGRRIGWGDSPALVIMDMTEEFTDERSDEGNRAVEANERLLERARETELPTFYTRPDRSLPTNYRETTKLKARTDGPDWSGRNVIYERLTPAENDF